jgi:hypothetical protein
MSAKTKRRAKERAQRQREIDRTLKDIAQSFRVLDPYTTSTYGSQWESYTNAYLQAQFRGIDRFSIPQYIPFVQGCTRGRTMRPSHLFGKCACYVCKLAEFAGLADRRRHCPDCGFCMFLLCPKTFELAWNHKETFKQKTYSCMSDSSDPVSGGGRAHETRLFMLWLCWAHKRRSAAFVGLGKLPRELIRLIAKFVK